MARFAHRGHHQHHADVDPPVDQAPSPPVDPSPPATPPEEAPPPTDTPSPSTAPNFSDLGATFNDATRALVGGLWQNAVEEGGQGLGSVGRYTNDLTTVQNGLLAQVSAGQFSGATLGHVQAILSDINTAISAANASVNGGGTFGEHPAKSANCAARGVDTGVHAFCYPPVRTIAHSTPGPPRRRPCCARPSTSPGGRPATRPTRTAGATASPESWGMRWRRAGRPRPGPSRQPWRAPASSLRPGDRLRPPGDGRRGAAPGRRARRPHLPKRVAGGDAPLQVDGAEQRPRRLVRPAHPPPRDRRHQGEPCPANGAEDRVPQRPARSASRPRRLGAPTATAR